MLRKKSKTKRENAVCIAALLLLLLLLLPPLPLPLFLLLWNWCSCCSCVRLANPFYHNAYVKVFYHLNEHTHTHIYTENAFCLSLNIGNIKHQYKSIRTISSFQFNTKYNKILVIVAMGGKILLYAP